MKLLLSLLTTMMVLLCTTLAIAQDAVPVQVPFDGTAIAQLIGSGAFAIACTALLRKAWPAIDGIWVWVISGALSVSSAVLMRHAGQVPMIVWEFLGPIATMIGAVGVMQAAQDAAKHSKQTTVQVLPTSEPSQIIPPPPPVPTITES